MGNTISTSQASRATGSTHSNRSHYVHGTYKRDTYVRSGPRTRSAPRQRTARRDASAKQRGFVDALGQAASVLGHGVLVCSAWLNLQAARLCDMLADRRRSSFVKTFDQFETFVTGMPPKDSYEFNARRLFDDCCANLQACVERW